MEIRGDGTIRQLEKDVPRSKCRKWKLTISAGIDPATGKYKQINRNFSGTYREAQAAMREFIKEMEDYQKLPEKSVTVKNYIEYWLKKIKGNIAPKTYASYENRLKNVTERIGAVQMRDVTPQLLEDMYAALRRGESVSGRKLSGTYVSNIAVTLHTVFKRAVREGIVKTNPCSDATHPKRDTKERKALRIDGITDLISKLDVVNPCSFSMRIIVKSGMRPGEVVNLNIEHLDFDNKIIHVPGTKTTKALRDIPMTDSLEKDFRARIAFMEKDFARARKRYKTSDPVIQPDTPLICNGLGKRFVSTAPGRWWRNNRAELGYPDWTPHELRHSYLSEMARRKTPAKVLQNLAGHESFNTTMDIYVHVDMEDKREATKLADW